MIISETIWTYLVRSEGTSMVSFRCPLPRTDTRTGERTDKCLPSDYRLLEIFLDPAPLPFANSLFDSLSLCPPRILSSSLLSLSSFVFLCLCLSLFGKPKPYFNVQLNLCSCKIEMCSVNCSVALSIGRWPCFVQL